MRVRRRAVQDLMRFPGCLLLCKGGKGLVSLPNLHDRTKGTLIPEASNLKLGAGGNRGGVEDLPARPPEEDHGTALSATGLFRVKD